MMKRLTHPTIFFERWQLVIDNLRLSRLLIWFPCTEIVYAFMISMCLSGCCIQVGLLFHISYGCQRILRVFFRLVLPSQGGKIEKLRLVQLCKWCSPCLLTWRVVTVFVFRRMSPADHLVFLVIRNDVHVVIILIDSLDFRFRSSGGISVHNSSVLHDDCHTLDHKFNQRS